MSPAPESLRSRLRSRAGTGSEPHADVVDIRPWAPARPPTATDAPVDARPDTVILGRWVPDPAPAIRSAAHRPEGPIADAAATNSTFGGGSRRGVPMSHRPGRASAPLPPRVPRGVRLLSSLVIAGGGVLAVLIAGDIGGIPVVATTALVATVVCGAILVAAQLTQEIGRARSRSRRASGGYPASRSPGR